MYVFIRLTIDSLKEGTKCHYLKLHREAFKEEDLDRECERLMGDWWDTDVYWEYITEEEFIEG